MTQIYRVIGPPGTGKTTYSARQARRAVEKYGSEGVLLLSLTKAAAAEIGSRDTGVDEELCSTIHAQCYRLSEGRKVVNKRHVALWNEEHPQWQISPATIGTSSEVLTVGAFGDDIYQSCDLLRNQLIPTESWSSEQQKFSAAWWSFMDENDVIDFTGMLQQTLINKRKPRYSIGAIIVDEVQDFSPLELAVLKQWSIHSEVLVMVGDLQQSLYSFRGATTESLEGEEHTVLSQSYRVPKAAHSVAMTIMHQMTSTDPVEFASTDQEGSVERRGAGFKYFSSYMPEIIETIRAGKTTMVIAPCGYMLRPIITVLRREGVPYWNPYNRKNAGWNPLTPKFDRTAIPMARRFRAYLSGQRGRFTVEEMHLTTKMFSKCWVRGGKKILEEAPLSWSPSRLARELHRILKPEVMDDFYEFTHDPIRMLPWVVPAAHKSYEYFCRVYKRYGADAFTNSPQVVVGTVHSVKGGESDLVIFFPDLSSAWYEQWMTPGWEGRDSLLRLAYVAVTRTRDKLILGGASGRMYMSGF